MESLFLARPADAAGFQTVQIQSALDRCRDAGGVVTLGAGDWHIASLRLYSNTTLHLSSGTHLIASADWRDYTDFGVPTTLGYLKSPFLRREWNLPQHYVNSPITAFDAENVAVEGEPGAWIDGVDCFDPNGEEHFRGPMGTVFCRCRGVTLRGYEYRNAANWCHQIDSCSGVTLSHVTVRGGHDGVNIHHCTNVHIEDCDFQTGDDCVAGYDAEHITVRRCLFNTACNAFRLGGRELLVEDCRFYGPAVYPHRVSGRHNTRFAFAYYAMHYDPCRFDSENWVIRRCRFEGLDNFIYYNYGNDWNHNDRPLRDLTLEDVTVTGLAGAPIVKTLPEAPLRVRMKNVRVSWRNGPPAGGLLHTGDGVSWELENVRISGINAEDGEA